MELIVIPQTNSNKNNKVAAAVRVPYQIITTTLLSLLLPLSFLVLARLSTAHYLLSVSDNNYPTPESPSSLFCSLFLFTRKNPTILHLSVSLVSVSSLAYGLTGKFTFLTTQLPEERIIMTRPRLFVAWVLLFVLQACVFLGIQGSEAAAAGIDGSGFGEEAGGLISRTLFFFGLHETMLFWGRAVVKPVVDDTIFGHSRAESWVEKAAMGLGYGALWWWRLRDEVEALVVVPVVKRELMIGIGVAHFVGWWLYYLTVTIGAVRVIKGFVWTVWIVTRRAIDGESRSNDEKV